MSAYICNPEHFGVLAAYAALNACVINAWSRRRSTLGTAQAIAIGLAGENIRSVAHRYPEDKDGERPGPCLKDTDIKEAAALYAAHFAANPGYVHRLSPLQIISLCQCLDYQSCETDDWRDTLAWRQLDWIKNEAIRQLPGYDSAAWSYDRPLPEIEALYEKEA